MSAIPLLVDADGQPPLPWLGSLLDDLVARQRGHALLLHAAPGQGALPLAASLAQSWLCEDVAADAPARRACGRCGSCRLVQAKVHPDLMLLVPEVERRALDWPYPGEKVEGGESSRKPSRQIRVDDVRAMIDWAFKTTARGRGKVAVIGPGEALNVQAANALLKTLEEPPPGTRIVMTAADPARLLPTVRSRCTPVRVPLPDAATSLPWLEAQGVAEAPVLLAATAGRPLDALELHRAGIDARAWRALPGALGRGGGAFKDWPLPLAVDTLLKLAHDAMACAAGATPRYFPADSLPPHLSGSSMPALEAWRAELLRVARHAAHPWNEGVLLDALAAAAARALAPARAAAASARAAGAGSRAGARPGGFVTLPS